MVYGKTRTYYYAPLDKERLDWITSITNRSDQQTQYLYQLVRADFHKLIALEKKIKNCFIFYCPDTREDVRHIMDMENKTDYFKIELP